MHSKGLDIDISDEASSTVIHVRAPVSARLCDVSCVFDKLGIDVRSCSKTPSASSCDMTLVVVDRHESQPLDDALKQSVTEGLQRVLNAHSQQGSPCSSGMQAGDSAEDSSGAGTAGSHRHNRQAAAAEAADVLGTATGHPSAGTFCGNSSGRPAAAEVCRADSASESIPASKASSVHLSPSDAPASEHPSRQHSWLDIGGISLHGQPGNSLLHLPAGADGAVPEPAYLAAAGSSSTVQAGAEQQLQPTVRFSSELSVCPVLPPAAAGLQRTLSGRPLKPALKIDIPSDSESSRWNNDSSNTSNNPSSRQARRGGSSSSTISISVPVERPQQQRLQQQGGVQAQDLVSRLMELGMMRPSANDTGGSSSDDDDDAIKSISCRSGGSSNSAGAGLPAAPGEWKRLNSRSCGDLLVLASKQQMACIQRASDTGPTADASEGQLDCFGASCSSMDAAGMEAQGDSSRSLGSMDQDQGIWGRRLVPPGAVSPAAVGAAAGGSGSGRRRRPPPRTPSRIILSPAAPDGSGESSGAPRLFVAIPKSGDERRSRRSSSVAATPRVPFTPASGMSILTPASARVGAGQGLKQLSTSIVGRKPASMSPTAAAAAEAAANMPYNVAVAAAQLLSCGNLNAREAAAAVVAAAAEKADSSTPLPSPLHVSAAAAAENRFSDDGMVPMSPRVPRTSPCSFQHPPPTPVHPAVAAAAAAAITAAAESAAAAHVMAHMQLDSDDDDEAMQLPACLSPQRSSYRLSSSGSPDRSAPMPSPQALATSAPGPDTILEGCEEGSQASDAASGSSSEEWWCQDVTGLTVRDIMTGPVKAVSADADMVQAKQLMMQHNLPGMLVDAGPGQAPGFLTRGDFFKANMMRRKGSRKRPHKPVVRDIMSPVLVVDAGMSIESCAQALQEAGVRHAAVRDPAAAADTSTTAEEAGRGSSQNGAISSMSAFVGLVSDAAIYRCLGLYPDYGAGEEELLEEGLLGLPHALRLHSGIDSSFDSSAGTETPLSSRSRVVTPLLDSMRGDVGQQQQERQASVSTDVGPSEQQSRQTSLVKLPDVIMLREGGGGQGSSAASSTCSVRSGATTAADSRKSAAGEAGATTRAGSFALTAAASDSSNLALLDAPAAAAEGQEVVPDALARYKHAAALWEVDMTDLEMMKRIGEGSFGEVMLATYRGTKVAVKRLRVLDLDDLKAPNEQYGADDSGNSSQSNGGSQPAMGASQAAFRQFFEREIAILASIRHPNVVNFIGACHKPGQRCLVTEYCARGSLDQVLHKSGLALDLSKRLEFAMDISRGMACLHAQRPIIIHRDLKTANLLVSARFEIKVADFGLSRIKDASHLQVSRAGLEGTIEYCAPEVLRGEPYTERCDVYSFGVVLWELLLRQRPYSDAEVPVFLLMVNIGNGTLSLPEVPVESATPGLVELVNRCLAFSACDRPEFREVLTLLEGEYRALRARQPPRSQRDHQQPPLPQQVNAGVLRCDSASSLAVHQQSAGIMGESPDPGNTPRNQSPAGTLGGTGLVPPALTPRDSYAGSRAGEDPYGWQQQQPWQGAQQQQQPVQRHRLSQHDSGMQSPPGSAAPSFGFGLQPQGMLQPAVTPQLQQPYQVQFNQQQQVFSMPLPHLQFQPQQQVYITSGHNSPRQQTPQQFAVPMQQQQPPQYVMPQLRVMSAFPSGNMGPQQQQQYQYQGYQQHPVPSGGTPVPPAGGTPVPPGGSTAVKPPRHKQQLSRARSMPVPQSVNWDALDADEGVEDGSEAGEGYQEEGGQDVLLFAEDSYGAVSNCSITGYSPCPSGQLCMLVEPASSTFGSSSAAGMLPYQQPQQQVLLAPNGQQMAVAQVAPMQPVLIQQPGGQLQQAYIQQQPTFATLAPAPQQQQQQQQQPVPLQAQAQRILQRTMGTPSPTPAALGRAGTPLSSSPSPAVNHLAVLAAVGAARDAARREGSASGATSPRGYTSSMFASAGGGGHGHHSHHNRSSSQGCSQDLPPLHLLQLGDMHSGSRPGSPQRSTWTSLRADRHSSSEGGGTPAGPSMLFGYSSIHHPQQPVHYPQQSMSQPLGVRESLGAGVAGMAGPAAMVTPLLLQRLDSLHRSGSSGGSPRCLHRSGSPGLHSGEQSGQLLGLLVPGFSPGPASVPNSPRSHSPRAPERHLHSQPAAVVAAVHHLNRPGSSRLAIQGSYELPPGAAAAAGAGSGSPGDAAMMQGASSSGGSAAAAMAPAGSASGVVYGDSGQLLPTFGVSVVHAPAGHVYHHQYPQPHPAVLQPSNRRAPSLLRIDSNSRDRAVSPFAVASGASSAEQAGHVGPSGLGAGHVAAAPAGTFSRTLSPFAAASSAGSSLEDVASRGDGNDVVAAVPPAANAVAAAAAAALAQPGVGAVGCSSARPPTSTRYVSPFAAAATRQEDDGDTDAVFDTRAERNSRAASPAPPRGGKAGLQGCSASGSGSSTARARLASPFALMQQQGGASEQQ